MKQLLCFFFVLAAQVTHAQKIAFLLDSYVTDRYYADEKYFSERIAELGGECIVRLANGDAAEQVRIAKKLFHEKIDALVLIATDAGRALEIIDAARKANIPVIAYERLVHSPDLSFYIGYNSVKSGRLQAQYAVSKVPQGNYILINGPVTDNTSFLIRNGQMSVLRPAIASGKIKILADIHLDSWGELEAMIKMRDLSEKLSQQPDAILAANDAIASGVIQSLPDSVSGVLVTGQDADQTAIGNILRGKQAMTVYQPVKPIAQMAAAIAIRLARGESINEGIQLKDGDYTIPALLLDPIAVDESNYEETVVMDGHYIPAERK